MATRAHAVFDVIYVKKLNIINLDSHIVRLMKSSESLAIKPPVSEIEAKEIVQGVMSSLISKMLAEGNTKEELIKQEFGIRLTISSGFGDFGVSSLVKY